MKKSLLQSMREEVDTIERKVKYAQANFDEAISQLMDAHTELAAAKERIRIAATVAAINPRISGEDELVIDELMSKRRQERGVTIQTYPKKDGVN